MVQYIDHTGSVIVLTNEATAHILTRHREMAGEMHKIASVLLEPDRVLPDSRFAGTYRYYRAFDSMAMGRKFICVVVKKLPNEAFVKTAFLTGRIR